MRVLAWVALGVSLGCGGKEPDPAGANAGGSGGAGAATAATGGTGASGKGGAAGMGAGNAGGSGNTSSGSGGSGNASTGGSGAAGASTATLLPACSDPNAVGPTPIRRLSQLEYANAVRDLFNVTIDSSDLPSDERLGGVFTANVVTPFTADAFTRYDTKAQTVADQVATNLATLSGCGISDAACVKAYFTGKARQAFHGVLEPDDQKLIEDLYAAVAADDAGLAAAAVTQFLLVSPRFLYVAEFGSADGSVARLSPGELAGRLASFLWRSVPDAALLAAADAGALADESGIREQATRLFRDAKALPVLQAFASEWLGVHSSGTDASSLALDGETGAVFAALAQSGATYADLFTTTASPASAELATYYGVSAGSGSALALPPEHAGLLLRAGFMRSHVKGRYGSPTLRGKQVRVALLCDPIAPPDNVNMNLPEPTGGQTPEDVINEHAKSSKCSGCHQLMDPIGAAFGNYGADGRFDAALTTSSAGSIQPGGTSDFALDFADTNALMNALSTSTVPEQCFALQTARFALGRDEGPGDACGIDDIWQGFQAGGMSLEALFVEVATSTLMQVRNVVKAGEACR